MCEQLDGVLLNFSETSLWILDITLAFIMFGVALNLKLEDFKRVINKPVAPLIGLGSQFLVLPGLTYLLIIATDPCPSMALGMFLVAACPGGNISNFMSLMAKGNVALSVSLSAVATVLAIVVTPISFTFWAHQYGPTNDLLTQIAIDPASIFIKVLVVMGIPLLLGMWTARKFPKFTERLGQPMNRLSMLIFLGYVIAALAGNFELFLTYAQYVVLLVIAHNATALISGYTLASLARLPRKDRRTIAIETGIQNSGLALVLIFSPLFNGLGGMAMVAAMWGLWHIISGLSLSSFWGYLRPEGAA